MLHNPCVGFMLPCSPAYFFHTSGNFLTDVAVAFCFQTPPKCKFTYLTSFLTSPSQIKLIKYGFPFSLPIPALKHTPVVTLILVHGRSLLPGQLWFFLHISLATVINLVGFSFKIYQEQSHLLLPWPGYHPSPPLDYCKSWALCFGLCPITVTVT